MSTASRDTGVDLLRVAGIVAVVAGHVWSDDVVRAAVYSWHVPLFFFLTGYLWTAGRSVWSEVQRRTRSLLRPYLVWLLLVAAVWLPLSATSGSATASDLARLVAGGQHLVRPFSAFWFVTALFSCTVLYRLLDRFPGLVAWAVAAAGLVTASLAPRLVLLPPWSAGTGVAALVFVLVGRAVRSRTPAITRPVPTGVALIASAALAILLGVQPLDLKHADLGTPVLSVAVASALCTGAVLVAVPLGSRTGRLTRAGISTLAASGLGVVLTHAVVIWALPGLPPPIVFLAATVLPWTLMTIAARTPTAPWLLGVPARTGSTDRAVAVRLPDDRPGRTLSVRP